MKFANFFRLITLLTIVAFLQGCASAMNPIGESKFDCNRKQDPKSPYCRSFKSAEAATTKDLPQSRFDQAFSLSEFDRMTGIAPDDQKPIVLPAAITSQVTGKTILPHQAGYGKPLAGTPVREGPVIQRTWIKRFVDDRDLLTENSVVYKEIRGTRWAGFDGVNQNRNESSGAYPHKPAAASPTPVPSKDSDKPQNTTDFQQPGDNVSGQEETATAPAASGASTMPQ